jgi:hypothetical protein
MRGRVSVGSGVGWGVVEREGGRVWGERARAVGLERVSRESAMGVVAEGFGEGIGVSLLGLC